MDGQTDKVSYRSVVQRIKKEIKNHKVFYAVGNRPTYQFNYILYTHWYKKNLHTKIQHSYITFPIMCFRKADFLNCRVALLFKNILQREAKLVDKRTKVLRTAFQLKYIDQPPSLEKHINLEFFLRRLNSRKNYFAFKIYFISLFDNK